MQVHKIHVLMAALCFVKAACLLFEAVRFSSIKKTVSFFSAVFSIAGHAKKNIKNIN